MEQNKMKVAIVGYGGMGGWHAERLLKSDACELTGIYDIRRERCELAESRGIRAYASYRPSRSLRLRSLKISRALPRECPCERIILL